MSDLFLKQLCFMYMYVFFCIQVVLDISTKTCGPCKIIYPKLVKMSKEYSDALFLRINGDLNSDTRVRLLPCTPQKKTKTKQLSSSLTAMSITFHSMVYLITIWLYEISAIVSISLIKLWLNQCPFLSSAKQGSPIKLWLNQSPLFVGKPIYL